VITALEDEISLSFVPLLVVRLVDRDALSFSFRLEEACSSD